MTYDLAIADRSFSSWSLRGWLMFENFDLPVRVHHARMRTAEFHQMLADFIPARTVPAMRAGDIVVCDSLAMAETLAERHPQAGLWPEDPVQRGLARSLVAEMHSGFGALRSACPMNLNHRYPDFAPDLAVIGDLERICTLWDLARNAAGAGPWLFGAYCLADVFYAPVAARIAGYCLPVDGFAAEYVQSVLRDPAFRRWRAMGQAEHNPNTRYDLDLPKQPWPGPDPLAAEAVEAGPSLNAACPYSGKPVAPDSLARIDGRIVGFCNQFCRDKSVADPAVWPKLTALLDEHPTPPD